MGVRGLSTYIQEHLSSVLEWHKLHHRNVIIDGNNLAHILYYECTGVNAAFGGDYDKYASFVQSYFERLQSCEVYAIVVMDGGQPLEGKKMRTVQERVIKQIQTCLSIHPSNQYRLKVFPCMGSQVFVRTLQKMGITVFQTDFEADEEIAQLSKKLGFTVLSNDSDFYVFDVPFILLESINHKRVCTEKKTKSREAFKYMACYHFSVESFCEVTGMDREHLPLLATLLGNDYLAFDVFNDFYAHLGEGKRSKQMTARHRTIRNVISWLASQKGRAIDDVITSVVRVAKTKKLRGKMLQSVNIYTNLKTNLLNLIPSDPSLKSPLKKVTISDSSLPDDRSDIERRHCETKVHMKNPVLETALFLKSGKTLPSWFIEAYRMHRIPHEVADILTQSYFISPPQVEDYLSDCSYLVVEPIVRSVYTMLWKGVCGHYQKRCKYNNKKNNFMVSGKQAGENLNEASFRGECNEYDSDVVVEEDSDENWDNEVEQISQLEEDIVLEDGELSIEDEIIRDFERNMDQVFCKDESMYKELEGYNELMASKSTRELDRNTRAKKYCLKWYLRKAGSLYIKHISYLPNSKAKNLPSLNEVGAMSVADKKSVFYAIIDSDTRFRDLDLPGDLELILDFIIYWFRRSKLSLKDYHALAVLICVFMYYIIDGKIGRIRTLKAFEDVERCKMKMSVLQDNAAYCNPLADVKDLLAHISNEECLVAGSNLFKFHHMDQRINDKYYSRSTVHAFSEYQACIYFLQLLNSLLCSPFPMLGAECLWGGTFCYNIFYDLKKRSNPLMRIAELLGRGTCLEKLFLKLFKKLGEVLNFKKCPDMLEFVENLEIPKKKNKEAKKTACKENIEGNKNINQRKEKGINKHNMMNTNTDMNAFLKEKETSVKQKVNKDKRINKSKEMLEKKEKKMKAKNK